MIITFSTHFFVYRTLNPQIISLLRKFEFQAIEVWCAEGHVNLSREGALALKRWCEDEGVKVPMGHGPFYDRVTLDPSQRKNFYLSSPGEEGEMALDFTLRAVEFLSVLSAEVMVLHTGFRKEDFEIRKENLARRIEAVLGNSEIKIALETEPLPLCRAETIKNFILEYFNGHPRVGLCVDVGHANVLGGVMSEVKTAGDLLFAIHASDNSGDADSHLPPGEGNVPWSKVTRYLKEHGWNGIFSLEVRDRSRGESSLVEVEKIIEKCAEWAGKEWTE